MAEKIRQYEAMFLFPSSASAELEGTINLCRSFIEKHGGSIILAKKWDERKLVYEINKQKRGLYVIIYFRAPTGAITPIEREAKLNEQVLRVLITEADHLNEKEMSEVEPQPIQKEERPPRDEMDFMSDRPPRRPRRTEEAGAGKD